MARSFLYLVIFFPLPPNPMAPALLQPFLDLLLLLLNFPQLALPIPVMELLLNPDLGLLLDGSYSAQFYNMAIIKAFLLIALIARLPVGRLLTGRTKASRSKPPLTAPFSISR